MKNTELKMLEKDQTCVKDGFSGYYRAEIIGKNF